MFITGSFSDSNNHPILNAIRRLRPVLNLKDGPWVAGGSVMSILDDSLDSNDIDIFVANTDQLRSFYDFVSQHLKYSYRIPFMDANWQTTLEFTGRDHYLPLQLIRKSQFETVEILLNDFDYTVVMAATDGKNWIADERLFVDLKKKQLILNSIPRRGKPIPRLQRYCQKGFVPGPGVLSEIMRINEKIPVTIDLLLKSDEYY